MIFSNHILTKFKINNFLLYHYNLQDKYKVKIFNLEKNILDLEKQKLSQKLININLLNDIYKNIEYNNSKKLIINEYENKITHLKQKKNY